MAGNVYGPQAPGSNMVPGGGSKMNVGTGSGGVGGGPAITANIVAGGNKGRGRITNVPTANISHPPYLLAPNGSVMGMPSGGTNIVPGRRR